MGRSTTTDKELQLAARRVALIRHHGTPDARAYGTCQDTPAARAALVRACRNRVGDAVPLTFLHHVDGSTSPATLLEAVPEPPEAPNPLDAVLAGLAAAGAR